MSYWVSFWPKGETRKTESKFKLGINNRESLKSLRKGEDINISLQDKEWRQGVEHADRSGFVQKELCRVHIILRSCK